MECYFCGGKMIWQNDFSSEDYGQGTEGIVSVHCCSEGGAMAEWSSGEEEEEGGNENV